MATLAEFWRVVDRTELQPCGCGAHSNECALDIPDHSAQGHCIRSTSHDEAVVYLWERTNFTFRADAGTDASHARATHKYENESTVRTDTRAAQWRGTWVDPTSGRNVSFVAAAKESSGALELLAPADFTEDAVLHLRRQ